MDVGIRPAELVKRLFDCLDANGMQDGVHIRLMVTRGVKATPYQDPRVTISPATIVIIPEYKSPNPESSRKACRSILSTCAAARPTCRTRNSIRIRSSTASPPACKPERRSDEALMLDPLGFVATCNSTHFFIVRRGEVGPQAVNTAFRALPAATSSGCAARTAYRLREAVFAL